MSTAKAISTPVKAISELRFYPVPLRSTAVERASRVGDTVVMIGTNGRIYTSAVTQDGTYWLGLDRMEPVLLCLVKIGVLSEEAIAEAQAAINAREAREERHLHVAQLVRSADKLGITLTEQQREAIAV